MPTVFVPEDKLQADGQIHTDNNGTKHVALVVEIKNEKAILSLTQNPDGSQRIELAKDVVKAYKDNDPTRYFAIHGDHIKIEMKDDPNPNNSYLKVGGTKSGQAICLETPSRDTLEGFKGLHDKVKGIFQGQNIELSNADVGQISRGLDKTIYSLSNYCPAR